MSRSPVRPPPHVLADRQYGAPPQIDALDGSETLVTVTIGGNDVGYIPLLMAASLPAAVRRLPLLGARIGELLDGDARDLALVNVFDSLCAVGSALRERAPARPCFLRRLSDSAAARRPTGAATFGIRRGLGPPRRDYPGTTHGRSRGGDGLRGDARRLGQPGPPRVVTYALDGQADEIRCAAAVSARTAASQWRRDAGGGGIDCRAVVTVSRWSATTGTALRCHRWLRGQGSSRSWRRWSR